MSIEFFSPPLVSGPNVAFFIPLPESLSNIPIAMSMGNGSYGLPVSMTIVGSWFCIFVLFLLFKIGGKRISVVPESKLGIALEAAYEFLDSSTRQMLGKNTEKYLTFISSLFFFILTGNLLTAIPIPWASFGEGGTVVAPAFRSPTADLNTTVGLALLTMVVFTSTKIAKNGVVGYFKGFLSPTPVLLPINLIGEISKPVNMSFRLFGNMFAGMVIMGLMYLAAPWVIPAPLHLYFDLFSGVVQSFVFIMLALVHIQDAIGDE